MGTLCLAYYLSLSAISNECPMNLLWFVSIGHFIKIFTGEVLKFGSSGEDS